MRRSIRRSWPTLIRFYLFVVCILFQGCSCDPVAVALSHAYTPCAPQDETVSREEPLTERKVVAWR